MLHCVSSRWKWSPAPVIRLRTDMYILVRPRGSRWLVSFQFLDACLRWRVSCSLTLLLSAESTSKSSIAIWTQGQANPGNLPNENLNFFNSFRKNETKHKHTRKGQPSILQESLHTWTASPCCRHASPAPSPHPWTPPGAPWPDSCSSWPLAPTEYLKSANTSDISVQYPEIFWSFSAVFFPPFLWLVDISRMYEEAWEIRAATSRRWLRRKATSRWTSEVEYKRNLSPSKIERPLRRPWAETLWFFRKKKKMPSEHNNIEFSFTCYYYELNPFYLGVSSHPQRLCGGRDSHGRPAYRELLLPFAADNQVCIAKSWNVVEAELQI